MKGEGWRERETEGERGRDGEAHKANGRAEGGREVRARERVEREREAMVGVGDRESADTKEIQCARVGVGEKKNSGEKTINMCTVQTTVEFL